MRWAGHVAHLVVGKRMCVKFWCESLRQRDHSEYLSADWRIILKRILKKHKRGGVEWINLVRDMETWQTPVKAVI